MRRLLAVLLSLALTPPCARPLRAGDTDTVTRLLSPAQHVLFMLAPQDERLLSSERLSALDAGDDAAVQAFAVRLRARVRALSREYLARDAAPTSRHPGEEDAMMIFSEYYIDRMRTAHPDDVPTVEVELTEEMNLRHRIFLRHLAAAHLRTPAGSLPSADDDLAAMFAGWRAYWAPRGFAQARAAAAAELEYPDDDEEDDGGGDEAPELREADVVARLGRGAWTEYQGQLAALDADAEDYAAQRRRVIERWRARMNSPSLNERIGRIFDGVDPLERTLLAEMLKGDDDGAAFLAEAAAKRGGERDAFLAEKRRAAVDAVGAHIAGRPDPRVAAALRAAGKTEQDLLVRYCGRLAQSAAETPGDGTTGPALQSLRAVARQAMGANFAGGDAGADALSALYAGGRANAAVIGECQTHFSQAVERARLAQTQYDDEQRRRARLLAGGNGVPNPAAQDSEDGGGKDDKSGKTDWKKVAGGAALGAIGFGFLGLLLGGPIGALALGALGAAALGAGAYFNPGGIGQFSGSSSGGDTPAAQSQQQPEVRYVPFSG